MRVRVTVLFVANKENTDLPNILPERIVNFLRKIQWITRYAIHDLFGVPIPCAATLNTF